MPKTLNTDPRQEASVSTRATFGIAKPFHGLWVLVRWLVMSMGRPIATAAVMIGDAFAMAYIDPYTQTKRRRD